MSEWYRRAKREAWREAWRGVGAMALGTALIVGFIIMANMDGDITAGFILVPAGIFAITKGAKGL